MPLVPEEEEQAMMDAVVDRLLRAAAGCPLTPAAERLAAIDRLAQGITYLDPSTQTEVWLRAGPNAA